MYTVDLREDFPEKNTLSFWRCPNWEGKPPAQIDFDTLFFLKENKLSAFAVRGGEVLI